MWVANIFFKKIKTQLETFHNKAQHKQELLCGKIFGSGRNVYVIDEPFYFHSTPINQNQGSARLTLTHISHLPTT
jgi:hypothetical protein